MIEKKVAENDIPNVSRSEYNPNKNVRLMKLHIPNAAANSRNVKPVLRLIEIYQSLMKFSPRTMERFFPDSSRNEQVCLNVSSNLISLPRDLGSERGG